MRFLLVALLCAISYAQTDGQFYHRRLHVITPECEHCPTWEDGRPIIEEFLADMKEAFEYHELPFDVSVGDHYSRPWPYPEDGSYPKIHLSEGDVNLMDMCKEWAEEYGRFEEQYNFDLWHCMMPGPLSSGASGIAAIGGLQAILVTRAFYSFKHELGHALGCAHQMQLPCPEGYEDFKIANQMSVRTIMSGYSQCSKTLEDGTKLDKFQMNIFTDKNRQYCGEGACFTMGDDNYDCAGDIRDNLKRIESNYHCDSSEDIASTFASCRLKEQRYCKKSTVFGTRYIRPVGCAELILTDNSLCPSDVFTYKNGNCQCCPMNYKEAKQKSTSLYKVQHPSAAESMLTFDVSLLESNVVRGLALLGVLSVLSLLHINFNKGRYETISNDLSWNEI